MATYISLDIARKRWVFQLRVPNYAREAFDSRTTIRKHIGSMPEAEALTRATQLADHYKSLFAKIKDDSTEAKRPSHTANSKIVFLLDKNIGDRFIATRRMQECRLFKQQLVSLRESTDKAWDDFEHKLTESITAAGSRLRHQHTDLFKQAFDHIQNKLNIQIGGTPDTMESFVHDFNAAALLFLKDCLTVVQGKTSVNTLFPDIHSQLPLIDLWGDPASQLAETWKDRILAVGGHVNMKTYDKYRGIALDLGLILMRRPVQSLCDSDLTTLMRLWRSRGNQAPTIKSKLGNLKTLLRPFDPDKHLRALVNELPRIKRSSRTARLPFTEKQLHTFANKVFHSFSVREGDKVLFLLLLLTAARIEELYQLKAEDFEPMEDGWLVRFVDYRQSGHGQSQLKTTESARRLPLYKGIFPALDVWLSERIEAGGYIFSDGSSNKYDIRSSAASKRLNHILRNAFPHDNRLVLQSTRNTANTIMRRGGTDPRVRHRYLGHADFGIHDRHYDPGELLDETDLESGARVIAEYVSNILSSNDGQSAETGVDETLAPACLVTSK